MNINDLCFAILANLRVKVQRANSLSLRHPVRVGLVINFTPSCHVWIRIREYMLISHEY